MATKPFCFQKLNHDNAVRLVLNRYSHKIRGKEVRASRNVVKGLSKLKQALDRAQVDSCMTYTPKEEDLRLYYEMRAISEVWCDKIKYLEVDKLSILRHMSYLGRAVAFFPSLKLFKLDVYNPGEKTFVFLTNFLPNSQLCLDFGVLKGYWGFA